MFKELHIKSSNSREGSSYKVETSVAFHAFFNGEIREEEKSVQNNPGSALLFKYNDSL